MAWNNSTDPDIPVQTISKNITLNVDGTISSTDYIENILKNNLVVILWEISCIGFIRERCADW